MLSKIGDIRRIKIEQEFGKINDQVMIIYTAPHTATGRYDYLVERVDGMQWRMNEAELYPKTDPNNILKEIL